MVRSRGSDGAEVLKQISGFGAHSGSAERSFLPIRIFGMRHCADPILVLD